MTIHRALRRIFFARDPSAEKETSDGLPPKPRAKFNGLGLSGGRAKGLESNASANQPRRALQRSKTPSPAVETLRQRDVTTTAGDESGSDAAERGREKTLALVVLPDGGIAFYPGGTSVCHVLSCHESSLFLSARTPGEYLHPAARLEGGATYHLHQRSAIASSEEDDASSAASSRAMFPLPSVSEDQETVASNERESILPFPDPPKNPCPSRLAAWINDNAALPSHHSIEVIIRPPAPATQTGHSLQRQLTSSTMSRETALVPNDVISSQPNQTHKKADWTHSHRRNGLVDLVNSGSLPTHQSMEILLNTANQHSSNAGHGGGHSGIATACPSYPQALYDPGQSERRQDGGQAKARGNSWKQQVMQRSASEAQLLSEHHRSVSSEFSKGSGLWKVPSSPQISSSGLSPVAGSKSSKIANPTVASSEANASPLSPALQPAFDNCIPSLCDPLDRVSGPGLKPPWASEGVEWKVAGFHSVEYHTDGERAAALSMSSSRKRSIHGFGMAKGTTWTQGSERQAHMVHFDENPGCTPHVLKDPTSLSYGDWNLPRLGGDHGQEHVKGLARSGTMNGGDWVGMQSSNRSRGVLGLKHGNVQGFDPETDVNHFLQRCLQQA